MTEIVAMQTAQMSYRLILGLILSVGLLSACTSIPTFRLDVQQGNAIEDAQVAQLQPGMTPQQVQFLLGTPQVLGAFRREDRWDYVEYHRPGNGGTQIRRVTVFFERGRVARIEDSAAESLSSL